MSSSIETDGSSWQILVCHVARGVVIFLPDICVIESPTRIGEGLPGKEVVHPGGGDFVVPCSRGGRDRNSNGVAMCVEPA